MRRLTLASLVLIASAASAADTIRATIVPQARPRLAPEIVATLTGLPAKPAVADDAPSTTPVLLDSATTAARARGEIVAMAPYIVAEPKVKAPSEYQMLTPKGRVELALKRRPGLKFLNFWGMNNGIALAMLQEDMAVERRREAAELLSLYLIK